MTISSQLKAQLAQAPIFAGLSGAEVGELLEVSLELSEPQGKVLFKEGDPADALIMILDGSVSVSRRSVELARLGKGAVLGEMSLLEETPRSATATSVAETKLLKIPSRRLQKLLKADNVAALKVVANLARVMSKRLLAINEKLVSSVEQRGPKTAELADFGEILTLWDF
jgi:CRP/FNR family transcriptional regulator, cyclic AMP receptor protein